MQESTPILREYTLKYLEAKGYIRTGSSVAAQVEWGTPSTAHERDYLSDTLEGHFHT